MPDRSRILILDKNASAAQATADRLRAAGFHCTCVESIADAASAIAGGAIDLLLADAAAAGGSEAALTEALPALERDLPVILLEDQTAGAGRTPHVRIVAHVPRTTNAPDLVDRIDATLQQSQMLSLLREMQRRIAHLDAEIDALRRSGEVERGDVDGAARGPQVGGRLGASSLAALSGREREVLDAFLAGHRVRSVANLLELSPYTVRNHLKSIFRKVGVRSQVELVRRAGHLARS